MLSEILRVSTMKGADGRFHFLVRFLPDSISGNLTNFRLFSFASHHIRRDTDIMDIFVNSPVRASRLFCEVG